MNTQCGVTEDPEVAARTGELLDRLGSDLTALDFARLAMACADQAGLPLASQATLASLIAKCFGHEVRW